MQITPATLYRFLRMHVDKLIKGNKCIHVPLHVCRSFAWQLGRRAECVLWMKRWCRNKKRLPVGSHWCMLEWRRQVTEDCRRNHVAPTCVSASRRLLLVFESEYKMRLTQRIANCVCSKSWRECLWELQSLNREQMLVLCRPQGKAFVFVKLLLQCFSNVSSHLLVCVARLFEFAVKWRKEKS